MPMLQALCNSELQTELTQEIALPPEDCQSFESIINGSDNKNI